MRYSTNGVMWQNVKDERLRHLAEMRAYEMNPQDTADEVWDNHDGTVDVNFGSTGATLTLRFVDDEAVGLFGYGYCVFLAYAIHLKTGHPFMVFTSQNDTDSDWHGHVAVMLEDGKLVDVTGFTDSTYIRNSYPNLSEGVLMDVDELIALTFSEEYRSDPLSFVEELEQLILADFADHIIQENNIPIKQKLELI